MPNPKASGGSILPRMLAFGQKSAPNTICLFTPDGTLIYVRQCADFFHAAGPISVEDMMSMREVAAFLALSALAVTATAQPATTLEKWTPISPNAKAVTGRVAFAPTQITFQNGKSLPLAPGGQMLFRPEPKKKKVMADMYRITAPDDTIPLCKGKPAAYLIVWKSEKAGNQADPRTLAPFSGTKLNAGSPDDCGRYVYDAGGY